MDQTECLLFRLPPFTVLHLLYYLEVVSIIIQIIFKNQNFLTLRQIPLISASMSPKDLGDQTSSILYSSSQYLPSNGDVLISISLTERRKWRNLSVLKLLVMEIILITASYIPLVRTAHMTIARFKKTWKYGSIWASVFLKQLYTEEERHYFDQYFTVLVVSVCSLLGLMF